MSPDQRPDGSAPPDWGDMVEGAQREVVRHTQGLQDLQQANAARLRRLAWLRRGAAGALVLALAGWTWSQLRPLPPPTEAELDRGRRALLALVNASLADHFRAHGSYPGRLDDVMPLQVELQYAPSPQGYSLSVRLSDGQLLMVKNP